MLKLSHRLERKPNTLSGGEQQRVALGRSLIRHPKILLLDEPLTNLDAKLRHDMRAELKRLHRQFGMTIIYATPDELEALSMGEEIAVMRDGAVVQRGTPDELYETPADLYVAGKIGSPHMNMIEGKVGRDGDCRRDAVRQFSACRRARGRANAARIDRRHPARRDIRLAAKGATAIAAPVHLLEPLGDVTIVSLDANGQNAADRAARTAGDRHQARRPAAVHDRSRQDSRLPRRRTGRRYLTPPAQKEAPVNNGRST